MHNKCNVLCCSVLVCAWLFVTLWTAARQASLSFTISRSLLKLMSYESVMPSNHLILCSPPLLLLSIFPRIRVFSSELVLYLGPKYHLVVRKTENQLLCCPTSRLSFHTHDQVQKERERVEIEPIKLVKMENFCLFFSWLSTFYFVLGHSQLTSCGSSRWTAKGLSHTCMCIP